MISSNRFFRYFWDYVAIKKNLSIIEVSTFTSILSILSNKY